MGNNMKSLRKNWIFLLIAIISIGLGTIAVLTSLRLREETPVAPNVPESKPQAAELDAVAACTLNFTLGRPNYCVDTSVDKSTLAAGESVTMTSQSTEAVNNFYFAVFNSNNLYSPGNPKPVCVTTGGDFTGGTTSCPAGTHQLIFKDPSTTLRTNGSRTVPFDQLFVSDQNNGGTVVTNVQINGYFSMNGGQWSLPQPQCVAYVASAPRPDFCVDANITDSTLSPGQSTTITSISDTPVDGFYYAFFNKDNVYVENGTPKPLCVTTGGDLNIPSTACPTGTHQLIYKDTNTTLRTNGTKTLTYSQIFMIDQNNGGQMADNVQVNAYFSLGTGQWSLPQAACVVSATTVAGPSPSPSPSATPGVSPSATPAASATPTPTPAMCNSTCTSSSQCPSTMTCYIASGTTGYCRNTQCVNETTCSCPAPTPTPTPTACNSTCDDNGDCPTNMICYITSGNTSGLCRTPACQSDTDCSCDLAQAQTSPTPTPSVIPTVPTAGTPWPTFFVVMGGAALLILTFALL